MPIIKKTVAEKLNLEPGAVNVPEAITWANRAIEADQPHGLAQLPNGPLRVLRACAELFKEHQNQVFREVVARIETAEKQGLSLADAQEIAAEFLET